MVSGAFFGLIAVLYYVCFLLLALLTLFIAIRGRRRIGRRSRLRRVFFFLSLSLLCWQLTLFVEDRTPLPAAQLWLGRANFTAMVFAVYFALRFVQEVPAKEAVKKSALSYWLLAETWLLAGLTMFTPLIDAAERVEAGRAITTFGPLFSLYFLHVADYLIAALVLAFRERRRGTSRIVRRQLTLIGAGMLLTGGVAFVTNALLPYGFGNFRFCDLGTFSTLAFVLSITYATLLHRLFDLRFILRETLVYGLLMTFVLSAYSSAVFLITQYLTEGAEKVTQFAVLLIAFSLDPLRRFLEKKADRLLFSKQTVG